jgi:hypothetical protein
MVLSAAGLALLAAVSPTALLIAAVFLGSARPRRTLLYYLVGAVLMSLIMCIALLAVLRGLDLSRPAEHDPRYGFRLALGLLLLIGAALVARRTPPIDGEAQAGFVSRLAATPTPLSAFLVGVLVFAPGASFLAAVQVIATARASFELTALAVLLVVGINVLFVWLPLLLYVAYPRATAHNLAVFDGWLRAHTHELLIGVLAVVGVLMTANGIYGLV